ncbi:MAG TPA: polysaccharide deacetylase family protein [Fibrobacteria bacterium]|nr:polysaccharide deacetylase family protein [Fibrobacteria bacterium]
MKAKLSGVPFLFGIPALLWVACLSRPDTNEPELPVRPEDSTLVGYRVRSYFNRPIESEWKHVFGRGSIQSESVQYVQPPTSIRLIGEPLPSITIEKLLNPPENVCGDVNVSVKVMAPSDSNLNSVEQLSIILIGGKDLADSANYSFDHLVRNHHLVDANRWTRLNFAMRTFNRSRTFDCRNVSRVRIRLRALAGTVDTMYFGEFGFYPSPLSEAALILTEDDQWADFDTNGVPAMRKHGFPGTIYVNGGLLGAFNKMTLERIKTLQDSGGWTIASHMWMHDSITALSDDSADRSLKRNAEFLEENGFTGYRHFAYPYGLVDVEKDAVVRRNCESARLTVGWPQGEAIPYFDRYRLRVLGFLEGGVTLDMAKSAIRQLVENKMAGILGVHQIVLEGPLDTRKWYREDWEALMDYVKFYVDQGRLKLYTLEQFAAKTRMVDQAR